VDIKEWSSGIERRAVWQRRTNVSEEPSNSISRPWKVSFLSFLIALVVAIFIRRRFIQGKKIQTDSSKLIPFHPRLGWIAVRLLNLANIFLLLLLLLLLSRDSSVCIATSYGLDCWGSITGRGKKFFSTPRRPDWLRGPPRFHTMGTGSSFSGSKAAGEWIWPLIST
jgi:hypothetical protein